MDVTTGSRRAVVSLPNDTQILITREFDAPRHLVWRAWTEPELIAQWWYAERGEIVSIEMDLRVGGKWRYVMRANEGFEVAFHGECREIVPDEKLVSTEIYEAVPDETALNTATFTEHDGTTTLTLLVEHASPAGRDMHINSGMEYGLQDALKLLEQLVASLPE
jgi:uncharacterized protein YndB with AHSA1/START domain